MTKEFNPVSGDTIITKGGWFGTCVTCEEMKEITGFDLMNSKIIAVKFDPDGKFQGYMNWNSDGIWLNDDDYSIDRIISKQHTINMKDDYCMVSGAPVQILTITRPRCGIDVDCTVVAMRKDNGVVYTYDKEGKNSSYTDDKQIMLVSDFNKQFSNLLNLKMDDKIFVDGIPAFFSHITDNYVGVFINGRSSHTQDGIHFYPIGSSVKITVAE